MGLSERDIVLERSDELSGEETTVEKVAELLEENPPGSQLMQYGDSFVPLKAPDYRYFVLKNAGDFFRWHTFDVREIENMHSWLEELAGVEGSEGFLVMTFDYVVDSETVESMENTRGDAGDRFPYPKSLDVLTWQAKLLMAESRDDLPVYMQSRLDEVMENLVNFYPVEGEKPGELEREYSRVGRELESVLS